MSIVFRTVLMFIFINSLPVYCAQPLIINELKKLDDQFRHRYDLLKSKAPGKNKQYTEMEYGVALKELLSSKCPCYIAHRYYRPITRPELARVMNFIDLADQYDAYIQKCNPLEGHPEINKK